MDTHTIIIFATEVRDYARPSLFSRTLLVRDLMDGIQPLVPKRSDADHFVRDETLPEEFLSRFREVEDCLDSWSTTLPALLGSVTARAKTKDTELDAVHETGNDTALSTRAIIGKVRHHCISSSSLRKWRTVTTITSLLSFGCCTQSDLYLLRGTLKRILVQDVQGVL